MRRSLSVAAIVLLAAVGVVGEAGAFTYENQSGDVSGSTPQFGDTGAGGDQTSAQSNSSSVFFGDSRSRPDRYDYDPSYGARPLPQGAQIGGGEHGFNNYTRYGGH